MKRKMFKSSLILVVVIFLTTSLFPVSAVTINEPVVDAEAVLPVKDDSLKELESSLSPVMLNFNEYTW